MAVTPTFRSNNFLSGSQTGSFTIAEPAGTAPGDIIIALIVNSTATGYLTPVDVGWQQLYGVVITVAAAQAGYFYRGSSAPNTMWNVNGGPFNVEMHVASYMPSAGTVFFDNTSGLQLGATGANHNPNPQTIQPIDRHTLAIAFGFNAAGSGAGGWGPSPNFTINSNNTAGNQGFVESAILLNSQYVNTGAVSNVGTGVHDYWDGQTITVDDNYLRQIVPAQESQLMFYDA